METILAPVDFSNASFNAATYAVAMAEDIGAKVILLHVDALPLVLPDSPVPVAYNYDPEETEMALAAIAEKLRIKTKSKVEITIRQETGKATYQIEEVGRLLQPFAVVMASSHPSPLEQMLFGSTIMHVAQHLPAPVIIVPEDCVYKPVRKIGLATDMVMIYDIPLHEMKKVLRTFHASLHVLHISRTEEALDASAIKTTLFKHHLRELNPSYHLMVDKNTIECLNKLIEELEIDILITIPRKHFLFHKSVSRYFIDEAHIPAVIIKEDAN